MLIAHGGSHALGPVWFPEPLSAGLMLVAGGLYIVGWKRRTAAAIRGPQRSDAAWFALGWVTLAVALMSPIHTAGETILSLHMLQHTLIILGPAALAAGRASTTIMQGIPRRLRGWLAKTMRPFSSMKLPFWALFAAMVATILIWHIPPVFEAAARIPALHATEHASLLIVSIAYWTRVLGARARRREPAAALASLFAMAVIGSGLGAVLTFASVPWYPETAARSAAAGVDWLADQQLAGVAMTVPMGAVFMGIAARLGWAWSGGSRWTDPILVRAEADTSSVPPGPEQI